MANFPATPNNGDTTTINGIVYIYDSTKTAWKRSTSYGGNLTVLGNITSANVITGNVYTTSGIYWAGNGAAYSSGAGGGGSSNFLYTASATAPGSPTKGDQWFDTGDGTLYEYMDDGDSFQWVDIQTPTFASNAIVTSLSGNVSTDGNISASSIIISSGIFWASNGIAFSSSVYSNVNVAAYLTSYTGNLVASNINISSNLYTGNVLTSNVIASNVNVSSNIYSSNIFVGNVTASSNITSAYFITSGSSGNITGVSYILASNFVYSANSVSILAGPDANIGTLFLGNASTQSNLGSFQAYANTKIGNNTNSNLVVQATTIATNMTTGALVVRGGVGIAGNVYANANVFLGGGVSSNLVANATTTSTSTTTGALVVRGGTGVAGNVYADKIYTTTGFYWAGNGAAFTPAATSIFATNLVAASGTTTSSTTTGALVVTGGAGITGGLYVGGDTFHTTGFLQTLGTITSTSADTGAITTQNGGGLGVTGNLYVGNEFVVPGGGKITSTGLAYLLEKANVVASAPSANINVDMSTVSVMYWTGNATANATANIRGTATQPLNSLLAVGQSVTAVIFFPNGPSNYLVNTVKIDNTTVTPAYQGNAGPVLGNSNSIDIYSFTILKTASATYKVFASQTQFMHPG